MATSKEYADFVCEHMEPFGTVSSRKMFGEYMVYIDGKAVLNVCDNTAFVKELPELAELMSDAPRGFPYDGAKEHYMLDVENTELLEKLMPRLMELTPMPKPKKRKA